MKKKVNEINNLNKLSVLGIFLLLSFNLISEVYVNERIFNLISSDLDTTHFYLECEHARTPKDFKAKVNIFTDHYYINLTNEISNSKYDKKTKLPSLTFEDTDTYTHRGIYMVSKNKESDFYREVLKLKYETMPVYMTNLDVASSYIALTRTYPWEPVRNVLGVGGVQYALLTSENFEMKVTQYAWQNNKRIMSGKPRKNTVGRCKLIDEEAFAEEIDQ